MEIKNKTIREIANENIADYLTMPHGSRMIIWDDGEVSWCGANSLPITEHEYIYITAPGPENLDPAWFTENFVHREESGEYVVSNEYHDDLGRVVGDLDDVIKECCRDGDVEGFIDDLEEKIHLELERD